ncbi:MAG: hypothetical protein ACOX8W_08570 [bacterium]
MSNRMAEIMRRLALSPSVLAARLRVDETMLQAVIDGDISPEAKLAARIVDVFNAFEYGRYDMETWTAERIFGGERIYGWPGDR